MLHATGPKDRVDQDGQLHVSNFVPGRDHAARGKIDSNLLTSGAKVQFDMLTTQHADPPLMEQWFEKQRGIFVRRCNTFEEECRGQKYTLGSYDHDRAEDVIDGAFGEVWVTKVTELQPRADELTRMIGDCLH